MSKKSNKWKNGMPSISLLKATLPWRSTDAIMINARNIGTTTTHGYWEYVPYTQQASTKRHDGNRMVLTYNDVGYTPKCPQIRVLLNNRATKRAEFLLINSGKVVAFG